MTSDTNLLVEIVKNGSELQIAGLIKDSLAKDVNKWVMYCLAFLC